MKNFLRSLIHPLLNNRGEVFSGMGAWIAANAATIAATTSAVATVASTVSSANQAGAQSRADRDAAQESINAAHLDESVDRRRSAQIIAKQQATAAASGLDISSGTPLELKLDSSFNAEMNALAIRQKGITDKNYYLNRSRQARAQIPGMLFEGVGKLASNYSTYKYRNP
jgi:hypothetical protein